MSEEGLAEAPKTSENVPDWKPFVSKVTPEQISLFRNVRSEDAKRNGESLEPMTEEQEREAIAKDAAIIQNMNKQLPAFMDQWVEKRGVELLKDYYKNRESKKVASPAPSESRIQRLRNALSNLVSRVQMKS